MKIEERFMSHVEKTENCWLWTGHISKYGYGSFNMGDGCVTSHRAAYTLLIDEIPEGLVVDHTCHSKNNDCNLGNSCLHRRCVNPDHLEAITQQENLRRSKTWSGSRTHCKRGHEYGEPPKWAALQNFRVCRTCKNISQNRISRMKHAT